MSRLFRLKGTARSRFWVGFVLGAWGGAAGESDACLTPASGNTLMYSASGSCSPGDTTVQWDKTGPQGDPGQNGAQGPPGAAATQGVAFGASTYTNGFTSPAP